MSKKLTAGSCAIVAVLGYLSSTGMDVSLKTSAQGLAFIAGQEQCRVHPYQCSAGVWTNGIGHAHVSAKKTANTAQVAKWFQSDIQQAEQVVNQQVSLPPGPKFDMAVDFVFNLGAGNFAHSTFLKRLKQGRFPAACNELLRWVYVNGKDCRIQANQCYGIVRRRQQEREICLHGYP
ncbi:lysozyme [Celerinatantimonas sp. MCCC 1A17872]|uniref:lysozyme n=1 Tax=Celerinatantimonas sp. MCCC 1A17872 TaxID=3177514 RepID=UPI0038CB7A3B